MNIERTRRRAYGLVVAALLMGCEASKATIPGIGGGDGGGGGNGGGGGHGSGGPAPDSVMIGVGNNFFRSTQNGSINQAVDTVAVGGKVVWNWASGSVPHNVASIGTPIFRSSDVITGYGNYSATFTTPGTYRYNCAIHGNLMSGRIVVVSSL